MERLTGASGNVEELVTIKSLDLSSSYRYLHIAEIWTKAKQPDKALEWAERGLKAFPNRPDNRLRDFLEAYLKRKRNSEALQLTWIQFEEMPILEHYKKLHDIAGKLESSRPGDAVVEQTSNTAYGEAIKLIRKAGGLMKAQGLSRQFGDYLAELRVQFKPKRNFIKLLDEVARSTAK